MVFHNKNILCCDFNHKKGKKKLLTGGEDLRVGFYKGPPFKKGDLVAKHGKYV